jgi:CheY-like chemotaxis protein
MSMSKKILIIEDCPDLLDLLSEALGLMGWETILADSEQEAMHKLEYELPNVILLDMRMSAIEGGELASILKAHPVYRNIPLLGATGHSSELVRQRCFALGCDELIDDPFELSELEMRLAKVLSGQKLKTIEAAGPINLAEHRRQGSSRRPGRRRTA